MYQIVLKGFIEIENPENLIEKLNLLLQENKADLVGEFNIFKLPPYVDYQKIDESSK